MNSSTAARREPISRRAFTAGLLATTLAPRLASGFAPESAPRTPPGGKWQATIIGRTGQGDYGHGLDIIFNGRDDIDLLAIADPDDAGRKKAVERSKAKREYSDHREMLAKEKPQLVCLAARWTNERHAAGEAALKAGAHLICEKPFTATLAEADDLLSLADRHGAKIAVAHQMRLAPSVIALQQAIGDGLIGDLLEMNAWGKQDDRAGGEDMIVLGSHLFDLMRLFAGDAIWCTARVLHGGREISRADARRVKEQIGPVAGDEIAAQFAFSHGIAGTFTSRKRLRPQVGHWGIEFVGTKTSARLLADVYPSVHVLQPGKWETGGRTDQWQPFPGKAPSAEERGFDRANRRVVDDWLDAIANHRDPACSGRNAMKSIEMIMAVYQAALSGARVSLPLVDRKHPLDV